MQGPQAHWLPDGKRLHLNHGPIDLIVEAFGERHEVEAAYAQTKARFQTILTELVAELTVLRTAVGPVGASALAGNVVACEQIPLSASHPFEPNLNAQYCPVVGPTARRMYAAVVPHAGNFITPMAAVAGSVADEVMAALLAGRSIDKAYVNNGGDIALHLEPGHELSLAVAGTGRGFSDRIVVRANDPVRGIATSGWRGRSFSLGIADAATVLAQSGAAADTAATIIANAVDLPGHPAVQRRPANELAPDSDLGVRMVTVGVGILSSTDIAAALSSGLAIAEELRQRGLIEAAALFLAGEGVVCGSIRESATDSSCLQTSAGHCVPFTPNHLLSPKESPHA